MGGHGTDGLLCASALGHMQLVLCFCKFPLINHKRSPAHMLIRRSHMNCGMSCMHVDQEVTYELRHVLHAY
jgi:hypothetical protein